MTRAELEHAIRAVADLTRTDTIVIVGSQSILGRYPDAPAILRRSMEVDVIAIDALEQVDRIHGVMGELSTFHRTYGFYVDAVGLETARLPDGWRGRLVPVSNANTRRKTGLCLDPSDLAASKLVAFREKDREFVESLLTLGLLSIDELRHRVQSLELTDSELARLLSWISVVQGRIRTNAEEP